MNRRTLRRMLDALGRTPEAVAATLALRGIRGHRKDSGHCPVAMYLHQFAGLREVSVCEDGAWLAWDVDEIDPGSMTLPDPVYQFTKRFDAGEFDELAEATQ